MILSKKTMLIALAAVVILIGAFFLYINTAFPKVRCEGAHLTVPNQYADCVSCHTKTTAKVAQDWQESKHGVMLVKCVVCHGEPDGKGSIPFSAKPDPMLICARCHDPAIKVMVSKFGENLDCNTCHPNHQNPQHGKAYQNKIPTSKTSME
jgi:NAD-dependent SIR2 family protein deacetylase